MNNKTNYNDEYLNNYDKEFIKDIINSTTNSKVYFLNNKFNDFSFLDNYLRNTYIKNNDYFSDGIKNLLENMANRTVYKIVDNFDLNYIFMKILNANEYIAIGPYINFKLEINDITKLLIDNNLDLNYQFSFMQFYASLPIISESKIVGILNNIAKYIYRSKDNYKVEILDASFNDIHTKKFNINQKPDMKLSMLILENRYEIEKKLLDSIKKGDRRAALDYLRKIPLESVTPYVSSELDDIRNKSTILNSLFRKSAQEAFVHPIYLDEISRKYNVKIYQTNNPSIIKNLIIEMTREYCDLIISKSLKNYSPIIRTTINYIDLNIDKKISLNDIAKYIGTNPSYLSSYFKKEMKVTLTDYINNVKINRSCKLLEETNLQIQEIAYRVGFYDVNYFTKIFKKIKGISPSKYRDSPSKL